MSVKILTVGANLLCVLLGALLVIYFQAGGGAETSTYLASYLKGAELTRNNSNNQNIIPFYLYPLKKFPSFWGENSMCNHAKRKNPKHDHAVFAWQTMMRHPWRVENPMEAQLAILPLSLDLWARGGCGDQLNMTEVQTDLEKVLEESPIFPSVRHLFIANDFKTKSIAEEIQQILAPAGIWVGQEGRGDCRTSLAYTSNYAYYMSMRDPNHVEMPHPQPFGSKRIYSVHMVGQVDERKAYADRLALFQSKGAIPAPYIISQQNPDVPVHKTLRICNSSLDTDRCLAEISNRSGTQLAQELSNYTLCLRGDTLGSDRWMNAMAAGTALIQVADNRKKALEWLPFPKAVPWEEMVLTIKRKDYLRDPAKSIRHIIETTTEERLLELQRLSLYHTADLDWTAHHSRTLENLINEAHTIPCKQFQNQK